MLLRPLWEHVRVADKYRAVAAETQVVRVLAAGDGTSGVSASFGNSNWCAWSFDVLIHQEDDRSNLDRRRDETRRWGSTGCRSPD